MDFLLGFNCHPQLPVLSSLSPSKTLGTLEPPLSTGFINVQQVSPLPTWQCYLQSHKLCSAPTTALWSHLIVCRLLSPRTLSSCSSCVTWVVTLTCCCAQPVLSPVGTDSVPVLGVDAVGAEPVRGQDRDRDGNGENWTRVCGVT